MGSFPASVVPTTGFKLSSGSSAAIYTDLTRTCQELSEPGSALALLPLLLLNPAWDWQCHTCFWGLAQAPVMFVKALLHCGQENAWKNSFPWSKALL